MYILLGTINGLQFEQVTTTTTTTAFIEIKGDSLWGTNKQMTNRVKYKQLQIASSQEQRAKSKQKKTKYQR